MATKTGTFRGRPEKLAPLRIIYLHIDNIYRVKATNIQHGVLMNENDDDVVPPPPSVPPHIKGHCAALIGATSGATALA